MKCTFGRSVDLEKMDVSRETLKMIFGRDRVDEDLAGIVDWIIKNPKGYHQKVMECYKNVGAEKPWVCKECGGACCNRAPCHYGPDDIKDLSYEGLKKLLKEKQYISVLRFPGCVCESCLRTVDYCGMYYYILRTRTRGTNIAAIATRIDKDDKCMLLTPEGCKISFDERPMGARMLIPDAEKKCKHLYDLDDCIHDWQDYQDVLRKVFHYFRMVETPKRIFRIKWCTLVKDQKESDCEEISSQSHFHFKNKKKN